MNFNSDFSFNFGKDSEIYFKLLMEEDFDFKTKNIIFDIFRKGERVNIGLSCDNVLDLKIGVNALIKSLEVIEKTLNL